MYMVFNLVFQPVVELVRHNLLPLESNMMNVFSSTSLLHPSSLLGAFFFLYSFFILPISYQL